MVHQKLQPGMIPSQSMPCFKMLLITEVEVTEAPTMAAFLSGQQHSSSKERKQDKCEGEPTDKTKSMLSSPVNYSTATVSWPGDNNA